MSASAARHRRPVGDRLGEKRLIASREFGVALREFGVARRAICAAAAAAAAVDVARAV